MRVRGVCYDVGRVFGKGIYAFHTRRTFDPRRTRRELEIIGTDLHCTAVRLQGRDLDRLVTAAEDALRLGLDVWLSPELFERDTATTLGYLAAAASAAERLRRRFPDRLVFCVGTEATLFVPGIAAGRTIPERLADLRRNRVCEPRAERLRAFLARAAEAVRAQFHGPLTYASLPSEAVDWERFDIVGVDHYRNAVNDDRYVEKLEALRGWGRPVVNTEFGHSAHRGDGGAILMDGHRDQLSFAVHRIPVVNRLVPLRLAKGVHVRDEALQARELAATLRLLSGAGVDGAFVWNFVDSRYTSSENPRRDLDMTSASLVRTYAAGRGATYPDMAWEPKAAFRAVADFYASTPVT